MGQKKSLRFLLDGSLLTSKALRRQVPYLLFLVVLAFIYIGNRIRSEELAHRNSALEKEIKYLKSKSIEIETELIQQKNFQMIDSLVKAHNLELTQYGDPLRKIIVKRKR